MKVITKRETKKVQNNPFCIAMEYPIGDKDINGAVIILDGRFPVKGRIAYILKGKGKLGVEGKEFTLKKGDLAFILPGERFYWEGNMEIFMPCTPAWYPEQHKEVD